MSIRYLHALQKNNNADDFDIIKNLEILSEEAKKSRFTPQKIN